METLQKVVTWWKSLDWKVKLGLGFVAAAAVVGGVLHCSADISQLVS